MTSPQRLGDQADSAFPPTTVGGSLFPAYNSVVGVFRIPPTTVDGSLFQAYNSVVEVFRIPPTTMGGPLFPAYNSVVEVFRSTNDSWWIVISGLQLGSRSF